MKRKQLKRQKGFKMLPNSRSVARPREWGNPFCVEYINRRQGWWIVVNHQPHQDKYRNMAGCWTKEQATQKATELYRDYAIEKAKQEPEWLDPLRGLDYLYCWCAEDAPWCHGDILIELLEKNESTT